MDQSKPVLVTGASGYVASWIVKRLLEEGYTVRGTVRNKAKTEKYQHLTAIAEQAPGTLEIFEANLLQEGAFQSAMDGCEIVMHTASPFQIAGIRHPQKELIDPALLGTRNILHTANIIPSVKRVVLTSSVVAMFGDAIDGQDVPNQTINEQLWNTSSSLEHQPYSYSKLLAEKEAWKIAEAQDRWKLVVINPGFVMGPALSGRTDGTSTNFLLNLINGSSKGGFPNFYFAFVDVRDVASAHFLAATEPNVSGRHLTAADVVDSKQMIEILKEKFGNKYVLPSRILPKWLIVLMGPLQGFSRKYLRNNVNIPVKIDNSYSKEDLGLQYMAPSQTLEDMVLQMEEVGLV